MRNSGFTICCTNIPMGNDSISRTGFHVYTHSVYLRMIMFSTGASLYGQFVRVLLFLDKNSGESRSAPKITDVIQTLSVCAPLNLEYSSRYKVLYDYVQYFGGSAPNNPSANGDCVKFYKQFIPPISTSFSYPSATGDTHVVGSLWLCVFGTYAGDADHVVGQYFLRTRFIESTSPVLPSLQFSCASKPNGHISNGSVTTSVSAAAAASAASSAGTIDAEDNNMFKE